VTTKTTMQFLQTDSICLMCDIRVHDRVALSREWRNELQPAATEQNKRY